MQTADRTAMAGIAAGLAGAVMTALLEKVFPDAPVWIWQSLFAGSAIILGFSLTFLMDEHFFRPRLRRTIMGPSLLIILSTLGFMAGIAWALTGRVPLLNGHAHSTMGDLRLTITRVVFDPNGPTELYVDFSISNQGTQTVVDDFVLTIRTPKLASTLSMPAIDVVTYKPVTDNYGLPRFIMEQLALIPLEAGAKRNGRAYFRFANSARDAIGDNGGHFNLTGRDVAGHQIEASFSCTSTPMN